MVSKCRALCIILIVVFSCSGIQAIAQPTLPDVAASADKGIVILSWNCQYNSIKLITVLRSQDSVYSYEPIGNVKNLDKGMQAFVDGHPKAGKNYYELAIVFKSGLKWKSNRCNINVDKSMLESGKVLLPSNDSLQHFTVTEEKVPANKTNTLPKTQSNTEQPVNTKSKISVSFEPEPPKQENKSETRQEPPAPAPLKHKIVITIGEPDAGIELTIKSKYINTNSATGHVDMTLPDDVNKHTYSVKFFDNQNHMAFEVPKIKAAKIIVDRKNFQHKGVYKFSLRKDYLELETGYVSIK